MSVDMFPTDAPTSIRDEPTSTFDAVSQTTIFTPEFTQNFAPNLDPAFAPETEYAIYTCGTVAPGQTHEPCRHSTTMVLCCACAGCMARLWSCRREVRASSWLTWRITQFVHNPWVLLLGVCVEAYAMMQLMH